VTASLSVALTKITNDDFLQKFKSLLVVTNFKKTEISSILERYEIPRVVQKRGTLAGRVENVDHHLDSTETEVTRSFHSY